jgi:hypothetical protein
MDSGLTFEDTQISLPCFLFSTVQVILVSCGIFNFRVMQTALDCKVSNFFQRFLYVGSTPTSCDYRIAVTSSFHRDNRIQIEQ